MLVIGVSGVTNGGKTTLAESLHRVLPRSHLMCQDTYFLPRDSPQHVLIPELGHFNWEILSSLDMNKMWNDIELIMKKYDQLSTENVTMGEEDTKNYASASCNLDNINFLIIEGFLVLNYKPIVDICDLKYHLTLSKEECFKRRSVREYDPSDVPGYFDLCVWPEYLKHKEEMLHSVRDVKVIDGTQNVKSILDIVLNDVSKCLKSASSTNSNDPKIS